MDKKLSITMISGPQNDMRHTGHVGCDGTTFGDVAFIVDNFDKLPKKPATPGGCGSFYQPITISDFFRFKSDFFHFPISFRRVHFPFLGSSTHLVFLLQDFQSCASFLCISFCVTFKPF